MSWGAPAEAPGLVAVPWAHLAAQAHLASRVGSCTRTSCSPPTPGTRRRSCRGRRHRGPAHPHRWLLHRDRCPLTTSQGKMVTTQPPPALSLLPLQGLGRPPRALSSISMTPGPHRSLNACNLGLVKGLHISSGREVLLRVSSLPTPPPPLHCSSCLHPAKGHVPSKPLSSLSASISQTALCYFPEPSPPLLPYPHPFPPGVSMTTAEGRKQLMASCYCALAAALCERKREDGKQESAQQNHQALRPHTAFSSLGHHSGRTNKVPMAVGWVPSASAHSSGGRRGSSDQLVFSAPLSFLQLCCNTGEA